METPQTSIEYTRYENTLAGSYSYYNIYKKIRLCKDRETNEKDYTIKKKKIPFPIYRYFSVTPLPHSRNVLPLGDSVRKGVFYEERGITIHLFYYLCIERYKTAIGNWSEQQEDKKEGKERDRSRKENLGKFFYDLAKLTFAGVVIGGIIPLYSDPTNMIQWSMVATGFVFTGIIASFANRIFK